MSEIGDTYKEIRRFNRRKEPERIEFAIRQIQRLGYEVERASDKAISFEFNGARVTMYPFTGWFTGKTVKDGRGIRKLLSQIKKGGAR